MRRAKSIFLHLILTISATSVCASDPEYGTGSKTLLKPGAEIPDKVMRNFSGRKTGRYYFGALAINPATPTDFFATEGLNSTQAAAAIAKIGCELNSGHTQTCEVVAVSVPQDASATFTQSMSLSAVEPIC
ncbi:hypothetical protein [Falsiphaeobacter marinintestinus]|uniref:hypothetical protein n=1 Tax=Falsiphaeobacter marinintestinus TaxID=1492905 RepID=UPI0011B7B554|nr:hypothetical protein [Phaeobacter marinintestinus]